MKNIETKRLFLLSNGERFILLPRDMAVVIWTILPHIYVDGNVLEENDYEKSMELAGSVSEDIDRLLELAKYLGN